MMLIPVDELIVKLQRLPSVKDYPYLVGRLAFIEYKAVNAYLGHLTDKAEVKYLTLERKEGKGDWCLVIPE